MENTNASACAVQLEEMLSCVSLKRELRVRNEGLERWLGRYERWLLFQKMQGQFSAFSWQRKTVTIRCNALSGLYR